MIEIGGKPILWHIMKEYAFYGHTEFIICAGYKQEYIKEWFSNYFLQNSDVTFDFRNNKNEMTISDKENPLFYSDDKGNMNYLEKRYEAYKNKFRYNYEE